MGLYCLQAFARGFKGRECSPYFSVLLCLHGTLLESEAVGSSSQIPTLWFVLQEHYTKSSVIKHFGEALVSQKRLIAKHAITQFLLYARHYNCSGNWPQTLIPYQKQYSDQEPCAVLGMLTNMMFSNVHACTIIPYKISMEMSFMTHNR